MIVRGGCAIILHVFQQGWGNFQTPKEGRFGQQQNWPSNYILHLRRVGNRHWKKWKGSFIENVCRGWLNRLIPGSKLGLYQVTIAF